MNFKILIVECLPDFISIPQPDGVSYGLFSDHIRLRAALSIIYRRTPMNLNKLNIIFIKSKFIKFIFFLSS